MLIHEYRQMFIMQYFEGILCRCLFLSLGQSGDDVLVPCQMKLDYCRRLHEIRFYLKGLFHASYINQPDSASKCYEQQGCANYSSNWKIQKLFS